MDSKPIQDEKPTTGAEKSLIEQLKDRFKKIGQYLTSKYFLRNFGAIILLLAILFVALNIYLKVYTRHNQTVSIGEYTGGDFNEARRKAAIDGFEMEVLDSSYIEKYTPGKVYEQQPSSGTIVKKGRTIYVKMGGYPQLVKLPTFDGDYNYGHYAKKLTYPPYNMISSIRKKVFNSQYEENTILNIYDGDKKITEADLKKGVEVKQGGKLEFDVTTRVSSSALMPHVVCLTLDEATFLINNRGLQVGAIHGNGSYVWKQTPAYTTGAYIAKGSQVDIYVTDVKPEGCK